MGPGQAPGSTVNSWSGDSRYRLARMNKFRVRMAQTCSANVWVGQAVVRKGWLHHASSAYSKPRLAVSLNKPKVCSMPFVRGVKPRRIVAIRNANCAFDRGCFSFLLDLMVQRSFEGNRSRVALESAGCECLNFNFSVNVSIEMELKWRYRRSYHRSLEVTKNIFNKGNELYINVNPCSAILSHTMLLRRKRKGKAKTE